MEIIFREYIGSKPPPASPRTPMEAAISPAEDAISPEPPVVRGFPSTIQSLTIYDHIKGSEVNYGSCMKRIFTAPTRRDFLTVYYNYHRPSELFYQREKGKPYYTETTITATKNAYLEQENHREVSSLSVFKNGVEPKWEDPRNAEGCDLSYRRIVPPKDGATRTSIQYLETLWDALIFAMLDEGFTHNEVVNGVRIVDSSNVEDNKALYRVELWLSTKEAPKVELFEREMRAILDLEPNPSPADKASAIVINYNRKADESKPRRAAGRTGSVPRTGSLPRGGGAPRGGGIPRAGSIPRAAWGGSTESRGGGSKPKGTPNAWGRNAGGKS